MRPLSVGDRVKRESVFGIEPRIGVVTEVYHSTRLAVGHPDTLYEVEWGDTGQRERGYLAVGLEKMD